MPINTNVSGSFARKFQRILMSILFMSSPCQIMLQKELQTMQKMPCLSLVSGGSSTLLRSTLNDNGTRNNPLVTLKDWLSKEKSKWNREHILDIVSRRHLIWTTSNYTRSQRPLTRDGIIHEFVNLRYKCMCQNGGVSLQVFNDGNGN